MKISKNCWKSYIESRDRHRFYHHVDICMQRQSKDSYTLMVEKKKRFKREKFRFPKPGNTLCADIAYLNEMQEGKWKFLLFCMDGFSRYLWITPLKSLKQKDVIPSLEKILKNSIYDFSFFLAIGVRNFSIEELKHFLKNIKLNNIIFIQRI